MSHSFHVSDETYESLTTIAAARGQTPEGLFNAWVVQLRAQTPSSPSAENGTSPAYDPSRDPLAPFLGVFEATTPDAVRRHDACIAEAIADVHDARQYR